MPGGDFSPAGGMSTLADEPPPQCDLIDDVEASAAFGIWAAVSHNREALGPVVEDIDANEHRAYY
jgi:hypothetical protein